MKIDNKPEILKSKMNETNVKYMFSNVLVLLALRLARFEKKTRVRKDPIDVPSPSPLESNGKGKLFQASIRTKIFFRFMHELRE